MNQMPILDIIVNLPAYFIRRSFQIIHLISSSFAAVKFFFTTSKEKVVSRIFWGRGSMYKNSFHVAITTISVVALLTGIAGRLRPATARGEFVAESSIDFDQDKLQQGASLQSVLTIDPNQKGFQAGVVVHPVIKGESVKSIAEQYGITPDTVRWANIKLIGPFSNYLEIGWKLKIPKVNGILHEVTKGEKLGAIVNRTGGNLFEVREINELQAPNYPIKAGQLLFIPSGNPYNWDGELDVKMLREAFEDPLSHPQCKGYRDYGGFTATHNGIDLTTKFGCPIRAIAPGVVKVAGWWGGGGGWTVIIDHGAGIESHSYHGNGKIWVKKGDRVVAGQDLMFMGSSGNSSGTHLHFTIKQNGVAFDPEPYIPFTIINPWN